MLQPSFELEMHLLKGHFKDLLLSRIRLKGEKEEEKQPSTQWDSNPQPQEILRLRQELDCFATTLAHD